MCRGTQAERSQKCRVKMTLRLVRGSDCKSGADAPSRGEEILSRKARSGLTGYLLRGLLSPTRDTLVGGCPWRCSGSGYTECASNHDGGLR